MFLKRIVRQFGTKVCVGTKTYLRIDFWFEDTGKIGEVVLHEAPPEDLKLFLTKAGLGGSTPQPEKVKL